MNHAIHTNNTRLAAMYASDETASVLLNAARLLTDRGYGDNEVMRDEIARLHTLAAEYEDDANQIRENLLETGFDPDQLNDDGFVAA